MCSSRRLRMCHCRIHSGGVCVTRAERMEWVWKHVRVTSVMVVMVVSGLLKTATCHRAQRTRCSRHTAEMGEKIIAILKKDYVT